MQITKIKIVVLSLALLLSVMSAFSQGTINNPGIGSFSGFWQYNNGQDTVYLKCEVRYFNVSSTTMRIAQFYYTFKQNNTIVWDNITNTNAYNNSDYYGSKPQGPGYDSLIVSGQDLSKRKTDEG